MTSRLQVSSGRKIRLIQMLWGGMDALYLAILVYGSLNRGKVPIFGDFYSGLENMQRWGGGLEFLIWLGAAVQISVIVTCVLFLAGKMYALYFAVVQFPGRLMFAIPSVSLLLVIPGVNVWLWMLIFLAFEVIKGWSLWWLWRNRT